MKNEELAEIAQARINTESIKRYYVRARDEAAELVAESAANVKVVQARHDKLLEEIRLAPAKIAGCDETLAKLDKRVKDQHVKPVLDKIAKLKAQLLELEKEVS